jgi:hydrogenase expression/formation protein HypE
MKFDKILLDHGSGGKISHRLTAEMLLPVFNNPILAELNDGAIFELNGIRMAFSTDSYTVDPIFFPGGSIGDLAINGTVNDIAMCGATPLYLSVGLIIEEGFARIDLEKIINRMGTAAKIADVTVVTGDTKVVPKGAVDRIFINTIADHGITILTRREGLSFESDLTSDTAPLNHMVKQMFAASHNIHVLRDPTRGGVGTALNEIAEKSQVAIKIYENTIPLKKEVAAACELLGFDPLYLANEGKLLSFVAQEDTAAVLAAIQANQYGKDAAVIGEVIADHTGKVFMETRIGGERLLDMLAGEQLPRIC